MRNCAAEAPQPPAPPWGSRNSTSRPPKVPTCAVISRPAGEAGSTPRTAPEPGSTRSSNRGRVAARSVRPPSSARYSPRKKLLLGTLKRRTSPASSTRCRAPHLLKQLDRVAVRNSLADAQDLFESALQNGNFLQTCSGDAREFVGRRDTQHAQAHRRGGMKLGDPAHGADDERRFQLADQMPSVDPPPRDAAIAAVARRVGVHACLDGAPIVAGGDHDG